MLFGNLSGKSYTIFIPERVKMGKSYTLVILFWAEFTVFLYFCYTGGGKGEIFCQIISGSPLSIKSGIAYTRFPDWRTRSSA